MTEIRHTLRNLLRPWAVPLPPTPPGTEALGPPPLRLESRPLVYRPAPVGTPLHPTEHPSKNAILLLFVRVRNNKTTTHVAKFAPSLIPCPYHLPQPLPHRQPFPDPLSWNQGPWFTPPSTRPALVGTPSPPHRASFKKRHFSFFVQRNNKNATHVAKFAPPPPNPFLEPRPLVYPPVHQASSGGYPRPPTRHSSKNAILLLFVRVRNNKNTTHVAKFAPSLRPVPLPPTPPPLHPPQNRSPWTPPEPLPHRQPFPDPLSWNQGPSGPEPHFTSFCTC